MITSYLLVSIYVAAFATQPIKPTTTYKLYPTQAECNEIKSAMQSKIKVGSSHTFCMKVKHLSQ